MPARILLVDDELGICEVLTEKLQALGFSVLTATAGYQAIAVLSDAAVDLVITDYHMKEGDGASLAHFCFNRKIPCIVITSLETENIRPYLPLLVPIFRKIDFITSPGLRRVVENTITRLEAV